MTGTTLAALAAAYFLLLLLVGRLVGGKGDNETFFRAGRQSPWWAVAYGMIGASISGVTFVSVPGMVGSTQFTYLQTCMGFILGYVFVACFLLPIYYRMNLTSIYTYLDRRLGLSSYLTGASFFFLSKLAGASIRLYLVCTILQRFIFDGMGVNFITTVSLVLLLIWLYTMYSGIKTIVWTDCLQTTVLLVSLVLIITQACRGMGITLGEACSRVWSDPMSRIFDFGDPQGRQYFWKQFLSGIFIPIVMTGLDQDMMQKNLTCKTLRQSRLNMCINGLLYLPVNLLFLMLGGILYLMCTQMGITVPKAGDELLPMLCSSGLLGQAAMACFTVGIVAAAFSSADSALTSLTTCFCVDLARRPDSVWIRRISHFGIACCLLMVIIIVDAVGSSSIIDAVYTVCGYTYGPLLGLFAFGMLTRRRPRASLVPVICVTSPIICFVLDWAVRTHTSYRFGYELLMVNGLLVFLLLLLSSAKLSTDNTGGNGHIETVGGDSSRRP